MLALTLADGSTIRVTPEHPFWVDRGNGFAGPGWLKAGELRVGDLLRTPSGVDATVVRMRYHVGQAVVYTLTVAHDHTFWSESVPASGDHDFFVGSAEVLVHNSDGTACDLIARLQESGVKITPENVVRIFTDPTGRIEWLETGNARAGLQHILKAHEQQFADVGISAADIPDALQEALTQGKIIGYQGSDTTRPIYQVVFQGKMQQIAITVGDNGFIVGANPNPD